jgi:cation transport ATPase
VQKKVGDLVSAGTVNSGNGAFTMQTAVLSEDSAVARLVQLVQVRASTYRTQRLRL